MFAPCVCVCAVELVPCCPFLLFMTYHLLSSYMYSFFFFVFLSVLLCSFSSLGFKDTRWKRLCHRTCRLHYTTLYLHLVPVAKTGRAVWLGWLFFWLSSTCLLLLSFSLLFSTLLLLSLNIGREAKERKGPPALQITFCGKILVNHLKCCDKNLPSHGHSLKGFIIVRLK